MSEQTEAEWWKEDADRLNALGDLIRQRGKTVDVGARPVPLNPDGSLNTNAINADQPRDGDGSIPPGTGEG